MIIFFFYFVLIILSCIGFGNFINQFFYKNVKENFLLGYKGLLGILFFNIYSYFYSIFLPHSTISNVTILMIGLILFITNKKNYQINSFFFLILIITFLLLLIGKPHDDFHYYHFPYSHYLNTFESIFGVGQLNHGFRTPSSIFYLNSLFNLPAIKFSTFHYGAGLYFLFANLILYEKIIYNIKKNSSFYIVVYSLCVFLFLNIFFYRLAEHGSDRSAQILILILFLEMWQFINSDKKFTPKISILFILISLIISLKAFYILYCIFGILILRHLYIKCNMNIEKISKIILLNPFFFISLFNIFLVLIINLINTGCLIYPLYQTCVESLPWTIDKAEVIKMNNWYQLWSKGGAAPNFRVDNPDLYLTQFNWVPNWIKIYFFNKVSDFLFGLFAICLIVYVTFRKNIINQNIKINYISILIIIAVLILEWFVYHPALRYGGYGLIVGLFFIPLSNLLSIRQDSSTRKKILILCSCALLILIARNFNRLKNEYKQYHYNPISNVSYHVWDYSFRITNEIYYLKNSSNANNEGNITKKSHTYVLKKIMNRYMIKKND